MSKGRRENEWDWEGFREIGLSLEDMVYWKLRKREGVVNRVYVKI